MKPHHRTLLFCSALLIAPVLYSLGDWLAGLAGSILLPAVVTLASFAYTQLGPRESPVGAPRAPGPAGQVEAPPRVLAEPPVDARGGPAPARRVEPRKSTSPAKR